MAKRKKHHKVHHRRRRVSGVHSGLGGDLMEVIGLVAGSVAATIAQRQLTSMNPKLVSAAELVGGHMLKKHAKSPLMTGIGFGLMSAGAIGLTHEFGVIHGVEDFVSGLYDGEMSGYLDTEMSGFRNDQFIGGLANEEHIGNMESVYLDEM